MHRTITRANRSTIIIITAALVALSACGGSSSSTSPSASPGTASTKSPATVASLGDATAPSAVLDPASAVLLRPVLQCFVAASGSSATATSSAPTGADGATELLAAPDGQTCVVGSAGATGSVFVPDADVQQVGEQWGVLISLRPGAEGEDILNALVGHCFAGDSVCPGKQLAIEVDAKIVSVPAVTAPQILGSLQITGANLDQRGAQALAYALNAGVGG